MADTPEGSIQEALDKAYLALPAPLTLPISWVGKSFTVPANKKYVQILFSPNTADRPFLGSNAPHRHFGVYQVNLHWPLGDFETVFRAFAAKIAAYFPADRKLTADGYEVRITRDSFVAPTQTGTGNVMVPIMIEYECWA